MKKYLIIIFVVFLVGCSHDNSFKIGYGSNLKSKDDINKLEKILNKNNISNKDIFISLVEDFNKEKDLGCGMVSKWEKLDRLKYDDISCMNRYEKNHDLMDGDCRITAFILLMNSINIKKEIREFGTYLMFDMDVIDNNDEYKIVKENRNKFITLFNELDVRNYSKDKIRNAYSEKFNEYVNFDNNKAKLISVIMHDNATDTLFIGHAGVLIEYNNKYIFIEKIAFEQPYQISIFKTKKELRDMLFKRENYFGDKTEEGPFIYENDKLIYEYKKTSK